MTEIIYKQSKITELHIKYEELLKIAKNIYEVGLYSKNNAELCDFLERNGEL